MQKHVGLHVTRGLAVTTAGCDAKNAADVIVIVVIVIVSPRHLLLHQVEEASNQNQTRNAPCRNTLAYTRRGELAVTRAGSDAKRAVYVIIIIIVVIIISPHSCTSSRGKQAKKTKRITSHAETRWPTRDEGS